MHYVFNETMICETLISDGTYTIGYVERKAAMWEGNATCLRPGDRFNYMGAGSHFGVNSQDEYWVTAEHQWEEASVC